MRIRGFKRTATMGAALTMLSLQLLTGAQLAHADGSCVADGCLGQDPQATGCAADAITEATHESNGRTIQLRFSPSCHAVWGRIYGGSYGDHLSVDSWHKDVGWAGGSTIELHGPSEGWTKMTGDDSTEVAQACAGTPIGDLGCTDLW